MRALFDKIKCFLFGHVLYLDDLVSRDENDHIKWPCTRCGHIQVKHYGLACSGKIMGYREPKISLESFKDESI